MSGTVLFKTIDGHNVITGFDRATVDPVETAKVVNEAIKDTPEYQAVEAKKAEYADAVRELSAIQKKYKKGVKTSREDQEKWNHALGTMSVRQDELKPLAQDLADRIIALRRSDAVYFEPRAGEVIRTMDEVSALAEKIKTRKAGRVIALDGSEIEDNRGRVFFRKSSGKWGRGKIVRLGDIIPKDSVLAEDVTAIQSAEIERDRVSGLSNTVKAGEKAEALNAALNAAADMRSRLEIQSDTKALDKSRTAYDAEVARIEGLYG